MNFQQLRIIRESVRCHFNLTDIANALFTSQSGVSKHIKDLEDELGIEIFVRRGKRFTGLTEPGRELWTIAERMLLDAANIKKLADQFSNIDQGQLTVVTTHTQARYRLPPVVTAFKKAFPRVHLALHQCSPQEIVAMLKSGEADIGIATEALDRDADLVTFPYYEWHHGVIVPQTHPLADKPQVALADIAEYPLITYHEGFTGRASIDRTFSTAGLNPEVIMSTLDSDVIKTYVELGLGIGIVASMAYHPRKDEGLALIQADHIFPANVTRIGIRRGHYLRGFAYHFIQLCEASLTEATVREALAPRKEEVDFL